MTEAAKFIQDLSVIMIAAAVAGLLCKRVGLSPIVGYLVAGIVVGPHTPSYFGSVTEVERVELFAQLGMVFLMFGIGLSFSLSRLRQLGLPMLLATGGTAFLVFNLARASGEMLGLDRVASLFLAGMLLVSSSAVIGKVLTDSGRSHEKSSQLALGITLSEDIVAIIMLTLLGSYVRFGTAGATAVSGPGLTETLALFGGFVLLLATLGLLLVPRVLRRLSRDASTEIETIFVAGMLFGLSLIVVRAGYSLALGAFLLGAIIAETPQRAHVERAFGGLRDFFGAIFFVAIGMTIDVTTLPAAAAPLVVLATLALLGRTVAAVLSLLVLGYDLRTAVRAGVIVTPLGEFSFIIAQMGTEENAQVLPKEYLSAVVGASLVTALVSPILIRHNTAIADRLAKIRVPLLERLFALHRRMLDAFQRQRDSSLLLRLTRKRFVQIAVEVALVTAIVIFAEPSINWIVARFDPELLPGVGTAVVCWSALGLLLLAPLIAIWRNVHAVAMIFADYFGRHSPVLARAKPLVTTALQGAASIAVVLWLWNFVPIGDRLWVTIGVLSFLGLMAAVLWRRFIRWHSTMEISLENTLQDDEQRVNYKWMDRYAPWGLQVGEITLPDRFAFAGKSIGEVGIRTRFGCSVIGIERQSFAIANPGPSSHLFPGDHVLVLGTDEQVAAVREHLLADQPAASDEDTFRDLAVELVDVPAGCRADGQTLADMNWPRLLGVQVVGHERAGARTLTPSGDMRVTAGDRLLVLGTPAQVKGLDAWLSVETSA